MKPCISWVQISPCQGYVDDESDQYMLKLLLIYLCIWDQLSSLFVYKPPNNYRYRINRLVAGYTQAASVTVLVYLQLLHYHSIFKNVNQCPTFESQMHLSNIIYHAYVRITPTPVSSHTILMTLNIQNPRILTVTLF